METLAEPLTKVASAPLDRIPPALAARVRRRIVDRESITPKLEVAAFNSAP